MWKKFCTVLGRPQWIEHPDYATPKARLPRLKAIFSRGAGVDAFLRDPEFPRHLPVVRFIDQTLQREMARKRMMQDVPKADVIVTNPTHIAVALKYDAEKMAAPRVVAKGADLVAQRIKEVARKNGIPLVENVPLARALHKSVKVGGSIPRSLYQAVAEVLAYVYRLKGKNRL